MRLGYRLHISSGGLRDNHLLRSLTFWGESRKKMGRGEIPFRLPGLLSSRFFPFFSWLASITPAYLTGDERIQMIIGLIIKIIIIVINNSRRM